MKIVDKLGVPITEGAVLYRLDDHMMYKVVRITSNAIVYEFSTMLPEQSPEDADKAMVASNFVRLYDAPQKARFV